VNYRIFGKMPIVMCCLMIVLVWLSAPVGAADNWVPIGVNDQTLYITKGEWRIAGYAPEGLYANIKLNAPITKYANSPVIGWMDSVAIQTKGEGWKFYLQDYAQEGWHFPNDHRQMGYVSKGLHFFAVRLYEVLLDKNNVVFGVKGECSDPVNGGWHPIQFYPVK